MTRGLIIFAYIMYAISIIFIPILAIVIGGQISSDKIPMQWGTDGSPTWYAPRIIGIWLPVAFSLIGRAAVLQSDEILLLDNMYAYCMFSWR